MNPETVEDFIWSQINYWKTVASAERRKAQRIYRVSTALIVGVGLFSVCFASREFVLPSIVAAIKNHMLNDVIWPNLSDEDGGAGLLTYQRLVEGGNPRFGRGDAKGYIRACDGLLARCLGVSHGRCRQRFHPESGTHHRVGSSVFAADPLMLPSRAISVDHSTDAG